MVHYYWLVKSDIRLPVFYGTLVAGLLGYRLAVYLSDRRGAAARGSASRRGRPQPATG